MGGAITDFFWARVDKNFFGKKNLAWKVGFSGGPKKKGGLEFLKIFFLSFFFFSPFPLFRFWFVCLRKEGF